MRTDLVSVVRLVLGKFAPICLLERDPRLQMTTLPVERGSSRERDEDVKVVLSLCFLFARLFEGFQDFDVSGGRRKLTQRVENRDRMRLARVRLLEGSSRFSNPSEMATAITKPMRGVGMGWQSTEDFPVSSRRQLILSVLPVDGGQREVDIHIIGIELSCLLESLGRELPRA